MKYLVIKRVGFDSWHLVKPCSLSFVQAMTKDVQKLFINTFAITKKEYYRRQRKATRNLNRVPVVYARRLERQIDAQPHYLFSRFEGEDL